MAKFRLFYLAMTKNSLTFAPTNEPTNEKGKEKAADLKGRKRIKSTGKGRQFFRANQQTNEVFNEKWQKWK